MTPSFEQEKFWFQPRFSHLTDKLNDTTGLLDLALGKGRNVAGLDDNRDIGKTTLSEELGESERKEVDDGGSSTGGGVEVLLARLSGDEGPQL